MRSTEKNISFRLFKKRIPTLLLLLLFLTPVALPIFGQELKNEKEVRVSKQEVPKEALEITEGFNLKRKQKWYKQTNFETTSFEVKFKWSGHFYSVEFDTTGQILDIEKLVKWSEISDKNKQQLEEIFDNKFDKWELKKFQIQYKGDKEYIDAFFNSEDIENQLTIRFEIELEGKKDALWKKFEFLVSSSGTVERERIIVARSTENLNY